MDRLAEQIPRFDVAFVVPNYQPHAGPTMFPFYVPELRDEAAEETGLAATRREVMNHTIGPILTTATVLSCEQYAAERVDNGPAEITIAAEEVRAIPPDDYARQDFESLPANHALGRMEASANIVGYILQNRLMHTALTAGLMDLTAQQQAALGASSYRKNLVHVYAESLRVQINLMSCLVLPAYIAARTGAKSDEALLAACQEMTPVEVGEIMQRPDFIQTLKSMSHTANGLLRADYIAGTKYQDTLEYSRSGLFALKDVHSTSTYAEKLRNFWPSGSDPDISFSLYELLVTNDQDEVSLSPAFAKHLRAYLYATNASADSEATVLNVYHEKSSGCPVSVAKIAIQQSLLIPAQLARLTEGIEPMARQYDRSLIYTARGDAIGILAKTFGQHLVALGNGMSFDELYDSTKQLLAQGDVMRQRLRVATDLAELFEFAGSISPTMAGAVPVLENLKEEIVDRLVGLHKDGYSDQQIQDLVTFARHNSPALLEARMYAALSGSLA